MGIKMINGMTPHKYEEWQKRRRAAFGSKLEANRGSNAPAPFDASAMSRPVSDFERGQRGSGGRYGYGSMF